MTELIPHPAEPNIVFGRGAGDFPAARVGDMAYAMLPLSNGGYYLASAWKLTVPIDKWTHDVFYGHGGRLSDETAFRVKVDEMAQHQRERNALGRREIRSRASTPWGSSQGATIYAEGVISHATASHGGFYLSPDRNQAVHCLLRTSGWYEEDDQWAAVALTFPDLFTAREREIAERTLREWHPDAYEAIFGRVLEPGESREKDRRAFHRDHAGDWIVISAIISKRFPGFTETFATLGGNRDASSEIRCFLVPSEDYCVDRFGFVIDETKHRQFDDQSEPGDAGRD